VVLCDFKAPVRVQGIVESLNHGMAFQVHQFPAEIALSLLDLGWGKGGFE
jgi:hypothetical protein